MPSAAAAPAKPSFKEQMLQAREDAIVQTASRLLAEKGFESMTVDEVAASVGIAKASLYKHFPSKEDLAAAAMVRTMQRTLEFVAGVPAGDRPVQKLRAVVGWAMHVQLAGEMPSLPHQNSTLRAALMNNRDYLDRLVRLSDTLGGWIAAAQADGALDAKLPPLVVLYTLLARACDPVLGFLKAGGQQDDDEIVALVLATCFDGIAAR